MKHGVYVGTIRMMNGTFRMINHTYRNGEWLETNENQTPFRNRRDAFRFSREMADATAEQEGGLPVKVMMGTKV